MTAAFETLLPVFLLRGLAPPSRWREVAPLVARLATLQTALSLIVIPLVVWPAQSLK